MLQKLLSGVRRTCWRLEDLPETASGVGIWGAGTRGRVLRRTLLESDIDTDFFVDNDEMLQDESIDGVPVLPLELLCRQKPHPIFISIETGYPMAMRLRRMGFEEYHLVNDGYSMPPFQVMEHEEDILRVYNLLADEESRACYLAAINMRKTGSADTLRPSPYPQNKHPLVKPVPGDVVINGGGYVGNVASNFARLTGRDCTIFSFEPCPCLFAQMTSNIEQRGVANIVFPENTALWKERGTISFAMDTPQLGNSRIDNEGTVVLQAVDLDSWATERRLPRIDLIELDVDGGEPEALLGAAGVIERYKPKLQISLYHSPQHLWELPLWIKRLVPDYTFYIGHHSHSFTETMLYATV